MSKKLFGKRSIAVLSTIAILVSLVAMLSGLSLTAEAAYTPARTISITSDSTNTGAKMAIINSQKVIGSGVTYTVKGYYKVSGFTRSGDVCYGYICHGTAVSTPKYAIYANADWTYFEFTGVTSGLEANSNQWIQFGFVNAYGTISLADVTMTNASGTKIYDMATDTALTAGTHTGFPWQPGMWYFNAKSATVGAVNNAGSGSGGGTSTGSLTLSVSKTTVASDETLTLSAPGATSITVSRVDGAWSNTYSGASVDLAFSWTGSYTATATNGSVTSNTVEFVVGTPTSTNPPTVSNIGTDRSVYRVGNTVTFTMDTNGDTNTLWVYYPDGTSQHFEKLGSTYTMTFSVAGKYEALVETWNGAGSKTSEKCTFTIIDPNATTTKKPTTSSSTTTKPTTSSSTTTKPTTSSSTTTKPTTSSSTTSNPTTSSTTKKPNTKKPTTKPVDPCAKGHSYVDGYCFFCRIPDPYFEVPHSHYFVNGTCIDCGAADPNYEPPHEHTFANGKCSECGITDPDWKDPNSNANTNDKDGKKDGGIDVMIWFWIALALFVIFIIIAILLMAKRGKNNEDDPDAPEGGEA